MLTPPSGGVFVYGGWWAFDLALRTTLDAKGFRGLDDSTPFAPSAGAAPKSKRMAASQTQTPPEGGVWLRDG
jgi:hypothetical protein